MVPRYVTNVSDLTATGAEFSARWFPTSALQFDFNLGWIDSTYDRYVTPDEFEYYARQAKAKGFLMVSSSPLTRSSHHAGEDFEQMRANREALLKGTECT